MSEAALKWTPTYMEGVWEEVLCGDASESATRAVLSKYCTRSVKWDLDGTKLDFEGMVKECSEWRGKTTSVKVEVYKSVTEAMPDGEIKNGNAQVNYLDLKDGGRTEADCFQIIEIDKEGKIVDVVEFLRFREGGKN